jgi:hypothetical protein
MVFAFAGIAAAQNEQDQRNNDQDQQQQSDEQDREREEQQRQREQQERQREEEQRQREEQERQREQQERQRQQQDQQRDQQNRQWDEQDLQRSRQSQWDETRSRQSGQQDSTWPQPTQYQSGRQQQTQYDSYGQRQSGQFDRQGADQDAGLGVNIISDGGQGVLVTQVHPGSPADEMGLRRNDRITHLNGQQVSSDQQFISRIRNMNPGDEVELEVLRNRDERIVRGELESRQDALVLSNRRQSRQPWQQGNQNWQTGYQEGGYNYQQQGGSRFGDYNSRINSIEQQVNRLSRELEQIRYALQDLRQGGQTGQMSRLERSGETQAGYYDESGRYQDGRFSTPSRDSQGTRSGEFRSEATIQGPSFQDSSRSGQFESSTRGQSSREGGWDSEGGVTGGLRTRPDNDPNWSNR